MVFQAFVQMREDQSLHAAHTLYDAGWQPRPARWSPCLPLLSECRLLEHRDHKQVFEHLPRSGLWVLVSGTSAFRELAIPSLRV